MICLQALIDGPCSDVGRKQIAFKYLHLTKFVIKIGRSARTGVVKKAWEKAEMTQKWAETTWAKKIIQREKVGIHMHVEKNSLFKKSNELFSV